jgi:tetratricopeptide (TPR) repeat protein
MKPGLFFLMILAPTILFSQAFKRKTFDYASLKPDTTAACSPDVLAQLENSFKAIEENNSRQAVKLSKTVFNTTKGCPQVYEVYGYSLFRSGEWFEGIDIIEKGIEKFGGIPELIKRRSQMSLEMAELGTGQKNIDGNGVFKPNSIKYEETQFKDENLRSALHDLEYLMNSYNRQEDVFFVAKIYQLLKNYERSTAYFQTLVEDPEYKSPSIFNIADNHLATGKYAQAETELLKLLKEYPAEAELYDKLAEISQQKNDKAKEKEYKSMAIYYKSVPAFTSLQYSKENFDLLAFFANDNKTEDKLVKLKNISSQSNQEYTIDVCLLILKLHANHGNGLEEEATAMLSKIGKPCIEKVHKLFQSNISTCTVTNLADVMATVKDEKSWELLVQYLPHIANMPATLRPPMVPLKMVKFDEDRAVREILIVVKPLLMEKGNNDLLSSFSDLAYYIALEKINKDKLRTIATSLNYSNKEFKKLEEKLR